MMTLQFFHWGSYASPRDSLLLSLSSVIIAVVAIWMILVVPTFQQEINVLNNNDNVDNDSQANNDSSKLLSMLTKLQLSGDNNDAVGKQSNTQSFRRGLQSFNWECAFVPTGSGVPNRGNPGNKVSPANMKGFGKNMANFFCAGSLDEDDVYCKQGKLSTWDKMTFETTFAPATIPIKGSCKGDCSLQEDICNIDYVGTECCPPRWSSAGRWTDIKRCAGSAPREFTWTVDVSRPEKATVYVEFCDGFEKKDEKSMVLLGNKVTDVPDSSFILTRREIILFCTQCLNKDCDVMYRLPRDETVVTDQLKRYVEVFLGNKSLGRHQCQGNEGALRVAFSEVVYGDCYLTQIIENISPCDGKLTNQTNQTFFPPPPPIPNPKPDPPQPPYPSLKDDPHIKSWTGKAYEFPIVCDVILITNLAFRGGIGMEIHARTSPWSGPKRSGRAGTTNMAIKIGQDVLEIASPLSDIHYWLNGIEGTIDIHSEEASGPELVALGENAEVPIRHFRFNHVRYHFDFDLGDDSHITIEVHNDFVNFFVHKAKQDDFDTSSGIFGTFDNGLLLGRKGLGGGLFNDPLELGREWQIREGDDQLFHGPPDSGPVYPEKCFWSNTTSESGSESD